MEMVCQITFMIVRTNAQISIPATGAILRGNVAIIFGKQEDHLVFSNATHQTKKKDHQGEQALLAITWQLISSEQQGHGLLLWLPCSLSLAFAVLPIQQTPTELHPSIFLSMVSFVASPKQNKTKLNY